MKITVNRKKLPLGKKRVCYNVSMDPEIIEPFRKICADAGMSLSRVFEGVADTFLKSMRPGENFKDEYIDMLYLYYDQRRNTVLKPTEIPHSKILP